jgi:hypothetical protein
MVTKNSLKQLKRKFGEDHGRLDGFPRRKSSGSCPNGTEAVVIAGEAQMRRRKERQRIPGSLTFCHFQFV